MVWYEKRAAGPEACTIATLPHSFSSIPTSQPAHAARKAVIMAAMPTAYLPVVFLHSALLQKGEA